MRFTKMQGAGNDFVLVEAGVEQQDWSRLSAVVCDRHFGIGADGLLVLLPSSVADFRMRVFNADGSESGVCGNGLRCMVRYYVDNHLSGRADDRIHVETMAGIREARLRTRNDGTGEIQTGMGKPVLDEKGIPVKTGQCVLDINGLNACSVVLEGMEYKLNPVSMGNPHAVYFTGEPVESFPLSRIGPGVATHEIFPAGVNLEVVNIIDDTHIEARVWERGVGETLACGSGACAITVAARLQGYIEKKVDIKLPGGALRAEWDGKGEVFLSGPAETVFTGELPG